MERDRYKYFRIEARELVDELGRGVLDLESQPSPELVGRLFRFAHTLKGAARVVKEKEIAEHAHTIEEILTPFRESPAPATRAVIDRILELLDAVRRRLAALTPAAAVPKPSPAAPASPETYRTVRADIEEMDGVIDGLAEVGASLATLSDSMTSLRRATRLSDLLVEQLASIAARGDAAAVTLRNAAEQLRDHVAAVERRIEAGVDQTRRELSQVRVAAERLRLLPVEVMFDALRRAVRDAATTLGKDVTFETRGAELRIDADVLMRVQGALLHVVRNAVAHGIEEASERGAAGKDPRGRIVLLVDRRGSRVFFGCKDDGRGIDLRAVRRVALERGLVSRGSASDDELLALLMRGGISTSESVTSVAGRGVGLDVVREVAASLGGEVQLRTEAGKGTAVEMVVPSSRSALDALVVAFEASESAIPLEAVRRTLRVPRSELVETPRGRAIVYDGKTVPFAPLRTDAVLDDRPMWSVVVVESKNGLAAVGVDRLVVTEEVVVRPLPATALVSGVVAAVCLDERGDPRPVLDPAGLVAQVEAAEVRPAPPPPLRRPILVIDDSVTTRMLERSILESAGYDVELAVSAEDGLVKARENPPALFLVDVEMPGMDGFTFIEQTRADPELRSVPAILVTSRDAAEDRARGKAVGASDYVVKGELDQAHLLERIRELVGY